VSRSSSRLEDRLVGHQKHCSAGVVEDHDLVSTLAAGPPDGPKPDLLRPAHRPDTSPARGARALAALSENCGVGFASRRNAEADLLRSALLAFEN